jgi:hypothetical protein
MKENTRWKILIGIGLVTLSLFLYTIHYLIFADSYHIFIFLVGDLAFVPIEILIVTIIIDQMLESREKQRRMEKLNMVIGTFFSTVGTPLVARLAESDTSLSQIHERLVIGDGWNSAMFADIKAFMSNYICSIDSSRTDLEGLRKFLVDREEFMIRLVENPMVFEHESFTDLILAINHLTEELKARSDLSGLPGADAAHLSTDIQRVYSQLILEWISYMEYLKLHYPYLFSLAMRKNPFDASASVTIRDGR